MTRGLGMASLRLSKSERDWGLANSDAMRAVAVANAVANPQSRITNHASAARAVANLQSPIPNHARGARA